MSNFRPAPIRQMLLGAAGLVSEHWALWLQDLVKRINAPLAGVELSADPANPADGSYIIWQSDGTGAGDDGDIMVKITAGGVTKTGTLVDYSTL